MDYAWDPGKAVANLAKHGVAFDAVGGFEWETALVGDDGRRSYGERRQIALGKIGGRLFVLIFTVRAASIRVISLRKANDRERRRYEKG